MKAVRVSLISIAVAVTALTAASSTPALGGDAQTASRSHAIARARGIHQPTAPSNAVALTSAQGALRHCRSCPSPKTPTGSVALPALATAADRTIFQAPVAQHGTFTYSGSTYDQTWTSTLSSSLDRAVYTLSIDNTASSLSADVLRLTNDFLIEYPNPVAAVGIGNLTAANTSNATSGFELANATTGGITAFDVCTVSDGCPSLRGIDGTGFVMQTQDGTGSNTIELMHCNTGGDCSFLGSVSSAGGTVESGTWTCTTSSSVSCSVTKSVATGAQCVAAMTSDPVIAAGTFVFASPTANVSGTTLTVAAKNIFAGAGSSTASGTYMCNP